MNTEPVLLFGYGNPSRGDDALALALIDAMVQKSYPHVQCLQDMQLQIEHITDLTDRMRILFVDADVSCDAPYRLERLQPQKDDSYTSHAMSPQALLHAYHHVYGVAPPASYLLRIRGERFVLGELLSDHSRINLKAAIKRAQQFCLDGEKDAI